jgi:hypothetical protein
MHSATTSDEALSSSSPPSASGTATASRPRSPHRRNETPLRLSEKRTKRDIEASRANLLDADRRYQLNTSSPFFYPAQHLKVDNTRLAPDVVARRIVEHFGLPLREPAS